MSDLRDRAKEVHVYLRHEGYLAPGEQADLEDLANEHEEQEKQIGKLKEKLFNSHKESAEMNPEIGIGGDECFCDFCKEYRKLLKEDAG